jgi:hypothetical protein
MNAMLNTTTTGTSPDDGTTGFMWCVLRFFAHRTSVTILGRENIKVEIFSTGKTVCDFNFQEDPVPGTDQNISV